MPKDGNVANFHWNPVQFQLGPGSRRIERSFHRRYEKLLAI